MPAAVLFGAEGTKGTQGLALSRGVRCSRLKPLPWRCLPVRCLRVVLKLGPRYDMGNLVPPESQWRVVAYGKDWCAWERK